MVIQRWQSVFLFVAAVLMVAVNFITWGIIDGAIYVTPIDIPAMFTLDIVTVIVLLVAIFMFHNFKLQKTLVRISALFTVISAIVGNITVYSNPDGIIDFKGGIWVLVAALILIVMAIVRIRADEQLIKSSDRIR